MPRIRWYHFYFCLAAFDVIVILVSLRLHDRTLDGVGRLISATAQLDERSRWLQLAQQRVLELNGPGNELFRVNKAAEYYDEQQRFHRAQANLEKVFDSASALGLDVHPLRSQVGIMVVAAEQIFSAFEPTSPSGELAAGDERSAVLALAGPAMAQMDEAEYETLRALGLLFAQNASERIRLLQSHQADLQESFSDERYFVAAVVVILVGALIFGRRLQQTDRALREERRRVEEEHRERLAAIGELCSSVAHGIRNPLAAIRSSAELSLQLGQLDSHSRERLQDIVTEGERLGDRVNGLLNIARASCDAFEVINLRGIVESAVRELRPELGRRGLAVETTNAGRPILIEGDPRHLQQMLIELLSNAMEYSHRGDTIALSCIGPDDDGLARVIVQDQGPGVPASARLRIFDLFFTTKPDGTGLGLATVKRVARLHHGDVTLESPPAGGARFVVTLPTKVNGNDAGLTWSGEPTDSEPVKAGRETLAEARTCGRETPGSRN